MGGILAVFGPRRPRTGTDEAKAREALALRACDVDLEAAELRIATLKRRCEHWRCVPVPEDLVHELAFVHHLRRARASPRARTRPLWPITRQAAHRRVGALVAAPVADSPPTRRLRAD